MYVGTYEQLIDDKGRIILPGIFRQALGKSFIISAGFDRCLNLWKRADWEGFVEREIARRSDLSSEARRLSRWFHASAHPAALDSQHRFLLPQALRAEAGLDREIILIGARNRVEIWARSTWRDYAAKTTASIEEIAERLASDLLV